MDKKELAKDLALGSLGFLGTLAATKLGVGTFMGKAVINAVGCSTPSQVGGILAQVTPQAVTVGKGGAVFVSANPVVLPIAACVAVTVLCVKYGDPYCPEDTEELYDYVQAHTP